MSMVGIGLMELLILIAGSAGLPSNDAVSLVQPEDYFKARNITVSADRMAELAAKDPADGKTQVQQLLAIRWLGENPVDTKKAAGARALLEQIAAGKKVRDAQGFAKLHAAQALARIDGKDVPPLATMPEKSLRGQALTWFPADITMAGGYDLRASGKTSDKLLAQIRRTLAKTVSGAERTFLFDVLDGIGNVRIDRVAGAFDITDRGNARRIFVRVSGAADGKRILDFLSTASKGKLAPETRKGPGGEMVNYFAMNDMCYAFISNNELFFLGAPEGKNPVDLIDELFAVKAGKKKSLPEGALAGMLRTVPENARLMFTGELPEQARKELTGKGSPLRAAPKNFLFHAVNDDRMTVTLSGTMKDKEEAEAFAESMLGLKQMALKALDNPPTQTAIPPEMLRRFKQGLQAVKVSAEGSTVTGKATVDAADVLGDVLKLLLEGRPSSEKPIQPEKPPQPE